MELRSRLVKKNLHDNFIMKIFALENIFRKIVLASDHKFLTRLAVIFEGDALHKTDVEVPMNFQ